MTDMNPTPAETVAPTSPIPDAPKAPETPTPTPERGKGRMFSLGLGAVVAAVLLSGYALVSLISGVVISAAPFLAGGALFVTLMTVFLSIVVTLKKMRRSSRKTFAILDCYMALAVIAVLGYFLAACVATFQPGNDASALWTHGVAAASIFALLFTSGKWAGQLFKDGASKS